VRYRTLLLSIIVGFGTTTACVAEDAPDDKEIRLVLQITVDGLRYDLVNRYADRFGEDGFRYLLDSGVVFANAHYQHSNTETIVGHTTLATGAFPADHGMTGNVWYDPENGELGYNIEDPEYPPLPTRTDERAGAQLDPAQQLARTKGRSPASILAETFSDRIAAYYGGRSKIFGVSGKDRGAVSMAGHAGKAFWMSTDNGDFVTSEYYYDAYPAWVTAWNEKRQVEALGGTQWELLNDTSTYLLAHQDDRPYETDIRGYGRVFPHQFAESGSPLLPTQVIVSPYGDKLTLDFAKALLAAEELGQNSVPDYLSISFSGVDAVNHIFGPSSLENEDMVLQLDHTLADLIAFIDKHVGLDKTLIVLSADHGMAEIPEYMAEQGYKTGRLYPEQVVAAANEAGKRLFDIDDIARFFFRPWLYLDADKIEEAGLDVADVRGQLASTLTDVPGIAHAVNRAQLREAPATPLLAQIQRNFHPQRSGDVYIVQAPYWFNFEKGAAVAMHGSPWRYDTHVPIIVAAPGIEGRTVHRLVHPVDLASTMSAILGMGGPGSSRGSVLPEALGE